MEKQENKNNILIKTTFGYTISTFLSKGIVFLMLPFYVRLLSKSQYGEYNNLLSWITLITTTVMMNLVSFIIKIENTKKKDIFSYMISSLYSIWIVLLIIFSPLIFFKNWFLNFSQLTNLNFFTLLIYTFLVPTYNLYTGYLRAVFKIKEYIVVNIAVAILTATFSLIVLLLLEERYKLIAFTIAQALPLLLFSFYYLIKTLYLEYKINWRKIKECLINGIPMIPHLLGITILSKIDRIMITIMVNSEATAEYSVANNFAMIVSTLSIALYSAFIPWMVKQLTEKKFDTIKKPILFQIFCLSALILGISFLSPEIIYICCGEKYGSVSYILPPLVISVLFNHIYTILYNIEYYYSLKKMIVFSSLISAIFNIVTNYIFIKIFGYEAAAYTTLSTNLLLLILHILAIKILKKLNIIPIKEFIFISISSIIFVFLIIVLYKYKLFRYILFTFIFTVIIYFFFRYKKKVERI